ncbi:MAG: hypothetical protein OXI94_13880 [Gemmatimonadota bacterium]|nr:hypothetical protein [Gemmatimonadota bacterium]
MSLNRGIAFIAALVLLLCAGQASDGLVGNQTDDTAQPGDFNGDEMVNFADFLFLASKFGASQGDDRYDAPVDLDGNGMIDFGDFLLFVNAFATSTSGGGGGGSPDRFLYTRQGSDPSWSSILEEKQIPIGTNSYTGITGSIIDVDNEVVEKGPHAFRPIESEINIHTLGNSLIPRRDFHKWSRWYQEDGNTQVFRLFDGEHNVRNARANAARIEAFSKKRWDRGTWHEWIGTYTIVKAQGCAIFQVKNDGEDWSIHLAMTAEGDVVFQPRRATPETVLKNMEGKSFDVRIRDNGHTSECYINGEFVGRHDWERPSGRSAFRWGMYVGGKKLSKDALLFVTGATVDPER